MSTHRGYSGGTLVAAGTFGGLLSALAVAALSAARGGSAVQPLNATSHWLNGPGAGSVRRADFQHTAVGFATHQASAYFWATLYSGLLSEDDGAPEVIGKAIMTAGIAGIVDYGILSRRLTPGWELVAGRDAVFAGLAGLAAGLAAGAMSARGRRGRMLSRRSRRR